MYFFIWYILCARALLYIYIMYMNSNPVASSGHTWLAWLYCIWEHDVRLLACLAVFLLRSLLSLVPQLQLVNRWWPWLRQQRWADASETVHPLHSGRIVYGVADTFLSNNVIEAHCCIVSKFLYATDEGRCGWNVLLPVVNWFCYVIAHDLFDRIEQHSNEPLRHYWPIRFADCCKTLSLLSWPIRFTDYCITSSLNLQAPYGSKLE